jgi:hypothetical protein
MNAFAAAWRKLRPDCPHDHTLCQELAVMYLTELYAGTINGPMEHAYAMCPYWQTK